MMDRKAFDVIITGGSYAGLSAAMALGRSLRHVLIIDSHLPCNRQTPHSHNFITQDGETPGAIRSKALAQVLRYPTIRIIEAIATEATKTPEGFKVITENNEEFTGKKLLFATGVADQMPDLDGFVACWGVSVLHCPYCHGYEVHGKKLGILANGDMGFEFSKLINNWTKNLVLFTNGKSTLTHEQTAKLRSKNIEIIEHEIASITHQQGQIEYLVFRDNTTYPVTALFARVPFEQHCRIPETLGCELTEHKLIKVDDFQKTTVPGVYAAGDNATLLRSVSMAVATGTKAGAIINKELIDEQF